MGDLSSALAANEAWRQAYTWLCRQLRHAPANSDVWRIRFHWSRDGAALLATVLAGNCRLLAIRIVRNNQDAFIALWGAQDALVLKWVVQIAFRCIGAVCMSKAMAHERV
ncbi:hypothetical protein [Pseudomonas fluorescens]|uniref:hypothetical protein n=1 Tax=Pseudomonas fluorescens TaxID=294 RepID=UPI001BE62CED|nr:hypothetical protein [Pseudomonas fluorescens]MBT2372346.1 hypothetical protein [Pseudomonas fluorescens]